MCRTLLLYELHLPCSSREPSDFRVWLVSRISVDMVVHAVQVTWDVSKRAYRNMVCSRKRLANPSTCLWRVFLSVTELAESDEVPDAITLVSDTC